MFTLTTNLYIFQRHLDTHDVHIIIIIMCGAGDKSKLNLQKISFALWVCRANDGEWVDTRHTQHAVRKTMPKTVFSCDDNIGYPSYSAGDVPAFVRHRVWCSRKKPLLSFRVAKYNKIINECHRCRRQRHLSMWEGWSPSKRHLAGCEVSTHTRFVYIVCGSFSASTHMAETLSTRATCFLITCALRTIVNWNRSIWLRSSAPFSRHSMKKRRCHRAKRAHFCHSHQQSTKKLCCEHGCRTRRWVDAVHV